MMIKFERLKNHKGWNWKTFVIWNIIKKLLRAKPSLIFKSRNPLNLWPGFNQEIWLPINLILKDEISKKIFKNKTCKSNKNNEDRI
jgi:hypothetical protein